MRESQPICDFRRASGLMRLIMLIGVGLALGACTKCDVPDFSHWWGSSAPHACDSGSPHN
jgi:hypothetical protein